MIKKIISGGQTGVDRAALDAATELGIPHGGWCPRGRRSEDGVIPAAYRLQETPKADYPQRTEWNVRDSDATLVLSCGAPTGGTALTVQVAAKHAKPCLIQDVLATPSAQTVAEWLINERIRTLNVAGPRASGCPSGYRLAREFLSRCLAILAGCSAPPNTSYFSYL